MPSPLLSLNAAHLSHLSGIDALKPECGDDITSCEEAIYCHGDNYKAAPSQIPGHKKGLLLFWIRAMQKSAIFCVKAQKRIHTVPSLSVFYCGFGWFYMYSPWLLRGMGQFQLLFYDCECSKHKILQCPKLRSRLQVVETSRLPRSRSKALCW